MFFQTRRGDKEWKDASPPRQRDPEMPAASIFVYGRQGEKPKKAVRGLTVWNPGSKACIREREARVSQEAGREAVSCQGSQLERDTEQKAAW